MPPRHPGDHLDVAQAAWPFLDVGFEVVGREVKAGVALLLFFELGCEKLTARPDAVRRNRIEHGLQQIARSGQQARLHERGRGQHVRRRVLGALADAADAVPQVIPCIPEQLDKGLDFGARQLVAKIVRQQNQ